MTKTTSMVPANAGATPVVNSIFDFSAEALGELRTWLEQNPPSVSIENIIGFSQLFSGNVVATQESTTSTSYTDLATAGPSLTLPDGRYLVLFASAIRNSTSGGSAQAGLFVNGVSYSDPLTAGSISEFVTCALFDSLSLQTGGGNTVELKYKKNSSGTAEFYARSLIALKQSNA